MRSAEAPPRPALLGIIGYPLHHTASPALHNAAFRALKLPWVYAPFRVEPRRLAEAMEALRTVGAIGFNVTYPHKEAVIEHLAKISPEARAVGAVNTVWRTARGWAGDNTDIVGFGAPLVRRRRSLAGAPAIIFGAGGAARAAAYALVRYFRIGALQVVARRKSQADRFARWAAELADGTAVSAARLDDADGWTPAFRAARLVVNATPVGMESPRERLLPAGLRFGSGQIAYDLVYGNATDFLARARRARATAIDGVPMLGAQAAQAFEIFTGRRYPWRAVLRSAAP